MMIVRAVLLLLGSATLASCGGGEEVASTPPPVAAPPPAPAPPGALPTTPPLLPNLTASTELASMGIENANQVGGPSIGFSVSYDASTKLYTFDLPTHQPAPFRAGGPVPSTETLIAGGLSPGGTAQLLWPPMFVFRTGAANPKLDLQYTSFAQYLAAGPMDDVPHGLVAFGIATPAGSVPTSGSAVMNGVIAGQTNDSWFVDGTVSMQFNFAAGTLTGSLSPMLRAYVGWPEATPLGRYDFTGAVLGIGNATFSGGLLNAVNGLGGSFDGRFTGPQAQEAMGRWQAFYQETPGGERKTMFGVLVAKRQ